MANVTISNNRYTAETLYQWDKNQILKITGLSLPRIPEIHFTNEAMGRAIVRQARMDNAGIITVDIPNSLLQNPYKIKAYLCDYDNGTFKSLYAIEIPVKARKKPEDYSLENDEEIYSFIALENLVNNTVVNLTKKCNDTVANVNKKCDDTISNANKLYEQIKTECNGLLSSTAQIEFGSYVGIGTDAIEGGDFTGQGVTIQFEKPPLVVFFSNGRDIIFKPYIWGQPYLQAIQPGASIIDNYDVATNNEQLHLFVNSSNYAELSPPGETMYYIALSRKED